MNLSDAAKSGRKFRRRSDPNRWYWLHGRLIAVALDGKELNFGASFDAEELTANDWETEPHYVKVCSEDLLSIAKGLSAHPICQQRRLAPVEFMKLVIEQLGIGEPS